jgi:hypothetical protein
MELLCKCPRQPDVQGVSDRRRKNERADRRRTTQVETVLQQPQRSVHDLASIRYFMIVVEPY